MSRQFDRYMLQVGIGTNRKLRRLPVAQRWAYVAGVLSLAAQSPLRGALLIADGEPATDQDVAEEATIPVKDARAALVSLRRMGMLEKDHHGVEWVHDWDQMNPEPKPSDSPAAARDRKRKQRERERAAREATLDGKVCGHCGTSEDLTFDHIVPRSKGGSDDASNIQILCGPCNASKRDREAPSARMVTRDSAQNVTRDTTQSHAPEVEVEVKVEEQPPVAPQGGRERDRQKYEEEMTAWAEHHFPAADPRRVAAVASMLQAGPDTVTADLIREYGREHPQFALESQETAAA